MHLKDFFHDFFGNLPEEIDVTTPYDTIGFYDLKTVCTTGGASESMKTLKHSVDAVETKEA